jgi:hypothetical protein
VSLKNYGLYVRLLTAGHTVEQMGFQRSPGDISRLNARVKIALNYRGLKIDNCADDTLRGYEALVRIFLVHSAFECYLPVTGHESATIEERLVLFPDPGKVVRDFFERDKSGKLGDFLCTKLKKSAAAKLAKCREGGSKNVYCLSAALRHGFAHGELTPNAYGIKPRAMAEAVDEVSTYVLGFINWDFSSRLIDYETRRRDALTRPAGIAEPTESIDQDTIG